MAGPSPSTSQGFNPGSARDDLWRNRIAKIRQEVTITAKVTGKVTGKKQPSSPGGRTSRTARPLQLSKKAGGTQSMGGSMHHPGGQRYGFRAEDARSKALDAEARDMRKQADAKTHERRQLEKENENLKKAATQPNLSPEDRQEHEQRMDENRKRMDDLRQQEEDLRRQAAAKNRQAQDERVIPMDDAEKQSLINDATKPQQPLLPINADAMSRAEAAENTLDPGGQFLAQQQRNLIANRAAKQEGLPDPNASEEENALREAYAQEEMALAEEARQVADIAQLPAIASRGKALASKMASELAEEAAKKLAGTFNRYIYQSAGWLDSLGFDGTITYMVGTSVSTYQLAMGTLNRMGSDLDKTIQDSPLGFIIPPGYGKDIIGMFMIVFAVFLLFWWGVLGVIIFTLLTALVNTVLPGTIDDIFTFIGL